MRQLSKHAAAAVCCLTGWLAGSAQAEEAKPAPPAKGLTELVLPMLNPEAGRQLFVRKGCFICHSVHGVGGQAAPALDAPAGNHRLDLMDFTARMWRGAPAMLELQMRELGYRIELSGPEIAHLAAFLAAPEVQAEFGQEEIPEALRDWQLQEPYWLRDNWPDFKSEFDSDGVPYDYR